MQTGLEKNLFGNQPVSLPATDSRGPPPAFASDPLINVSGGGRENNASSSVVKDETNMADGYSAVGVGPSKLSVSDIMEVEGPSSPGNYVKNSTPVGVSVCPHYL